MRLNLLRVFWLLTRQLHQPEARAGCQQRLAMAPIPQSSLLAFPHLQPPSSLFLSGTSSVIQFFFGNAAAAAVDIDLGCGKGYIYPSPYPSSYHSPFPTTPPSLPSSPLRKGNPFIYLKFCRHFALIYILADCFLGRKCGTASALPCPPPARPALPCPLCVCSCATCQTFVAAVTSLRERQHRGRRLRLISSLQRAAVSLSLILLHHAVSVSMQLSSLRPHSKQTATPILPTPTPHLLLHISPGSSVYLRCCLLQNLSYAISAFFKYSMA